MKKFQPFQNIDGFDIYAPELLDENQAFSADVYLSLEGYEKNYFWFSARRELIYFLIEKYFSDTHSYCEIGCGGGYLLEKMKQALPRSSLSGTEIMLDGLKMAAKRTSGISFFQADILNFPFEKEFDLIGIYDVIEHIDDDEKAIQSIYDALSLGGGLILTVPQHRWLWSVNDDCAYHRRRYSKHDLVQKCEEIGFDIIRITSFTSLLLPAFIINCLFNRGKKRDAFDVDRQFYIYPIINFSFKVICKIELILIKMGINFLCGGSLVCILRKQVNEKNRV